jgi:ATP-dependent RNA helicase DeaD
MSKDTEERIPEEDIDPKSKIAREADAFLSAIAGGADEDEADEAAFFATNPNGVVVDEEGDVLKKGPKSAIEVGTKVEIEEGEVEQELDDESAEENDKEYAESKKDCAEPAEESDEDPGDEALVTFEDLGLADEVLEAIKALNYETPSPIQAKAIPALLQGANLLGTAQTGTGKTAAFSLPLLSRLSFNGHETSMLVLTPTRELAIQVAEAIQQYAAKMPKVHVVPVYGGQDIAVQLRALKRQANIVVATPGRLIDHIKRGSIVLSSVKAIVLDEADEMLDMGFMEDVETILKEIPADAQRALFSATMPADVKKIIDQHLGEYEEARIEGKTTTVENIRQRYLLVKNEHKIEALARVLEGEDFDGVLIFVRTKQNTTEVAEKLESRGFNVAPLNGDLAQSMRERTINRLKMGKLDIVVATDVAARGIDVDRISLVVNYDIPYDTESYVHRVGRTGRAGRSGNAILFITPREKRMLKTIEKATRQPIEAMEMPTADVISAKRVAAFKAKIKSVLSYGELDKFKELVRAMVDEGCDMENGVALEDGSVREVTAEDIAAAVIKIWQKKQPLFPELKPLDAPRERGSRDKGDNFGLDREEKSRLRKERKEGDNGVEEGYLRYYLGVGRRDHVTPKDIVGAIAGEGNISSSNIGRIKLFDKFSTVELPETMPQEVLDILAGMTIRGNESRFRLMTDEPPTGPAPGTKPRGKAHPFENRRARREKMFGDKKFRKEHDERSFGDKRGDKPFRKTRRFGRV